MGQVIKVDFRPWETEESEEEILASMAGCTVEFKETINKFHLLQEETQAFLARVLSIMEKSR